MSIKRILICITLITIMSVLAVSTGCAMITGSGSLSTNDYSYTDFTKIEVGHAFEAEITRADSYLVRITLDDNLYDYLKIGTRGDTLYIGLKPTIPILKLHSRPSSLCRTCSVWNYPEPRKQMSAISLRHFPWISNYREPAGWTLAT